MIRLSPILGQRTRSEGAGWLEMLFEQLVLRMSWPGSPGAHRGGLRIFIPASPAQS